MYCLFHHRLCSLLCVSVSFHSDTAGSPEEPLSDLGKSAYQSYWREVLICYFERQLQVNRDLFSVSLGTIARATGIRNEDVVFNSHRTGDSSIPKQFEHLLPCFPTERFSSL